MHKSMSLTTLFTSIVRLTPYTSLLRAPSTQHPRGRGRCEFVDTTPCKMAGVTLHSRARAEPFRQSQLPRAGCEALGQLGQDGLASGWRWSHCSGFDAELQSMDCPVSAE